MSKGSARRKAEDRKAFEDRFAAIDWGTPREEPPEEEQAGELVEPEGLYLSADADGYGQIGRRPR